jgi:HD superfamily phosphohydrolase
MHDIWSRTGISFDEPIRDPLWRNVMLPSSFASLVSSPAFVKLSRILQLGPAHLVYPGATHTRRAHSIGVFEMAKRVLGAIDSRADLRFIDASMAAGFLVAALCHDLGHFPYAHSLKELPLREHESLTSDVVRGPMRAGVEAAGADPEFVAAIVDQDMAAPSPSSLEALTLFRSLLSGVLDPDKLDYLNRDAWSCGVPYGIQDVDFTLQHLGLDQNGRPGISERGVMAVEAVLFSKYQMYRAVYWHKSVRAATAMIKKAVIEALAEGSLEPAQLYGLDDQGFYSLMDKNHRDRAGLIRSVFDGDLLRTAAEFPFDPGNPAHLRALDLGSRPYLEAELAKAAASGTTPPDSRPGQGRIVVDVPEPISFESDLPVIGTNSSFTAWSTVFRPELVESFTRSLRVLRVYAEAGTVERVAAASAGLFGACRTSKN